MSTPSELEVNRLVQRDARDRVLMALGLGLPYPLRNLPLQYPEMVPVDQSTEIKIVGGQRGVIYRLCDEDGNPISEDGKLFESEEKSAVLRTPVLKEDRTFSILASRQRLGNGLPPVETYLVSAVSIKVGINVQLPVGIEGVDPGVEPRLVTSVDYRGTVTVWVDASQEGVSYQLISLPDGRNASDQVVAGSSERITISSCPLEEDVEVAVRASRTSNRKEFEQLVSKVSVRVRPNPDVGVGLKSSVVPFGETAGRVELVDAQSGVEYQLYRRLVLPEDYVEASTENALSIPDVDGVSIHLRGRVPTSGEAGADWSPAAVFSTVGSTTRANLGRLEEDSLFCVRAKKVGHPDGVWLKGVVAALVRPNPGPRVAIGEALIEGIRSRVVKVSGTQAGVTYQLRMETVSGVGGKAFGLPGCHPADRGLGRLRIGVDFIVESRGDSFVVLPTDGVPENARLVVMAVKTLTRLSAPLNEKVTLGKPAASGVTPDSAGPPEAPAANSAPAGTGKRSQRIPTSTSAAGAPEVVPKSKFVGKRESAGNAAAPSGPPGKASAKTTQTRNRAPVATKPGTSRSPSVRRTLKNEGRTPTRTPLKPATIPASIRGSKSLHKPASEKPARPGGRGSDISGKNTKPKVVIRDKATSKSGRSPSVAASRPTGIRPKLKKPPIRRHPSESGVVSITTTSKLGRVPRRPAKVSKPKKRDRKRR